MILYANRDRGRLRDADGNIIDKFIIEANMVTGLVTFCVITSGSDAGVAQILYKAPLQFERCFSTDNDVKSTIVPGCKFI